MPIEPTEAWLQAMPRLPYYNKSLDFSIKRFPDGRLMAIAGSRCFPVEPFFTFDQLAPLLPGGIPQKRFGGWKAVAVSETHPAAEVSPYINLFGNTALILAGHGASISAVECHGPVVFETHSTASSGSFFEGNNWIGAGSSVNNQCALLDDARLKGAVRLLYIQTRVDKGATIIGPVLSDAQLADPYSKVGLAFQVHAQVVPAHERFDGAHPSLGNFLHNRSIGVPVTELVGNAVSRYARRMLGDRSLD